MDYKIARKLYYLFNSGKNSKLVYYFSSYWAIVLPHWFLKWQLRQMKTAFQRREDKDYIAERVAYYNRLSSSATFDRKQFLASATMLSHQEMTGQKVYFLDSFRYAKSFDQRLRWVLLPGDIVHVPELPSITKSRPLAVDNTNSVLMKLDRVRHFIFVKDKKTFREKKNIAIFRGLIGQDGGGDLKKNRHAFVEKYFGHEMCDVGVLDKQYPKWYTRKLTIKEHLDYKFIMALEGNDVASNLKWVMSSNSVAVMPRPTCETWFMEGLLKPNVHYIEIKPDFSDLPERLQYYIDHPAEAEAILENAHRFVEQFKDAKRESLISLLVLEKYFAETQ
ncbi:MAG: glycosyl transferase family 90 [Prevotella sp.]|nr:glycosyl transferase family 90 [Prevotellaceae bacterium]MDY3936116.1 glycosyl transferase family 90 [Prevotella sp.]